MRDAIRGHQRQSEAIKYIGWIAEFITEVSMRGAGTIPRGFVSAHRSAEDASNIRAPICCHPGRPARSGRRSGGGVALTKLMFSGLTKLMFAELTKLMFAGRRVLSSSDLVSGRGRGRRVLRADHDGRARPGRAHADGRRDCRVCTDDDGHGCGRWQRHRRRHDSQDRRTGRRRANTKGLERVGLDGIANGPETLEALLAKKGGTVSDRLDASHSGIDASIDGAADAPLCFLGPGIRLADVLSKDSLEARCHPSLDKGGSVRCC